MLVVGGGGEFGGPIGVKAFVRGKEKLLFTTVVRVLT